MNTRSVVSNADIKKKSITFMTTAQGLGRYPWFNPTTLIPSECEVLFIPKDKATGKPLPKEAYTRVAKYLPGAISIWKDELSELDQKKRGKKIKMSYGYVTVSVRNRNLLEYLRVAAYNAANELTNINSSILYKELDHEANAEKIVKKDRDEIAAKNFVLNGDINGIKAIAVALATNRAEVQRIYDMDEWSLRQYMTGPAKNNPKDFLGKMKDGKMKNKVFIVQALQKGIIAMDEDRGIMNWTSGGEIFLEAPSGMDPMDYFAELAVDNDEYRNLLGNIKVRLNKLKNVSDTNSKDKKTWIDILIEDSLECGTLIQKGHWYIVPDKSNPEGEAKISMNGKRELARTIRDNDDNIIALLSAGLK